MDENQSVKSLLSHSAEIAKNITAMSVVFALVFVPANEMYMALYLDKKYVKLDDRYARLNERYATRGQLKRVVEYTIANTDMILDDRKTLLEMFGIVNNFHKLDLTEKIEALTRKAEMTRSELKLLSQYMIELEKLKTIEERCKRIYEDLNHSAQNSDDM